LAWFAEAHEIVAVIAAGYLNPHREVVCGAILDVPNDAPSVAKAMAAASIRPDTEFREEDKATACASYSR
jgi:hypothetical protein